LCSAEIIAATNHDCNFTTRANNTCNLSGDIGNYIWVNSKFAIRLQVKVTA
jgi:hypothetical protein